MQFYLLIKRTIVLKKIILGFITKLVSALDYLHVQDVVHRDLKAENIKITKDGVLKLLDFGHAKDELVSQQSWLSKNVGTINCNAPEQFDALIAHRGSATYKADVWSLGVLIHYLCSLKLPFMDKDE